MAQQTTAMTDGSDRKRSEIVDDIREDLKGVESLADTPFSALFHEARTTSRRRATGVTLQVRVRDGEFEVHDTPVKTRQGEHLRGTDAWDGMISLPVRSFMEVRTACQEIRRQLEDLKRTYLVKEQRAEEREKFDSGEWSR